MAKSTYRVTGPFPLVIDKKNIERGAEFTADLPPELEEHLLKTDQIKAVTKKKEG